MTNVKIRSKNGLDKKWIHKFVEKQWGADKIVLPNGIYIPSDLSGFIADKNGKPVGLVTYIYELSVCKIITLNVLEKHEGIGTLLLDSVIEISKRDDLKQIMLYTTNDNVDGLRFYQKRGFIISKVYLNQIINARKIKPEISMIGEYGIPIRDDIELSLNLH
jgi:GNAT superfamily N-acetyltransferase